MKRKLATILAGVIAVAVGVTLMSSAAPHSAAGAPALPGMCNGRVAQNLVIEAQAHGVGDISKFILNVETDPSGKASGTMILERGGDRLEVTDWCRVWQHIPGQTEGGMCGEQYPPGAITAHTVGLTKRDGNTILFRADVRKLADGKMLFRVRYRTLSANETESEGDSCEGESWTRLPAKGWAPLDQLHVATVVRTRPAATTAEASSITGTSAVLNGTIVPHWGATSYHFQYGITAEYGSRAPATDASVGSGDATHTVAHEVSRLQPNRTYHFRLVGKNAYGTSYGADRVFTTRATPTVATGAATSVSAFGAVLNGLVNPENLATGYYFEFGPSAGYGARVPVGNAPIGSDHAEHGVSQGLSGLIPNTTYHFRLVAMNATGTRYGRDATFTTPSVCFGDGFSAAFNVGHNEGFNREWKASYGNSPSSAYNRGFNAGYRAAQGRSSGASPAPPTNTSPYSPVAPPSGQSSCSSDYNLGFNRGYNSGFASGFNAAWRSASSSSPNSAYSQGFRAGYSAGRP